MKNRVINKYNKKYWMIRLTVSRLILLVLMGILPIFFILSCTSKENPKQRNTEETINWSEEADNITDIFQAIKIRIEDNPIRSLVLLDKYKEKNLISSEEFEGYVQESLTKIKSNARKFFLAKKYFQSLVFVNAYTTYNNFVSNKENNKINLSTSEDPIIEINEIYYNIIMQSVEEKNYPKAQKYITKLYQEYPDYFEEKNLFSSFDVLDTFQDKNLLNIFCAKDINFDSFDKERFCGSPNEDNSIRDMLNSTFVIEIDKGISKDGLGREIGSAFFISKDGYALTNYHVIKSEVSEDYEGKSEMTVKLKQDNYKSRPAEVIGYDELVDLALIKVDDIEVENAFSLRHDINVNEGDDITVIGSPLGLVNTVTSGIISSKNRVGLLEIGSVMQIDASVNPGNSGGPLLDKEKNVIGVVVAKILGVENINFAIPGQVVQQILPDLFDGSKVTHSWLGIGGFVRKDDLFEVLYIDQKSPAKDTSLEVGDIIRTVNNHELTEIDKFQVERLDQPVNQLIELEILKQGKEEDVEHILIVSSERDSKLLEGNISRRNFYEVFPILTGTKIEVTHYNRAEYRFTKVFKDSPADIIGFTDGDLISIKKLSKDKNYVVAEIKVIQQKRGFLEDVMVIYLELSTKNFI